MKTISRKKSVVTGKANMEHLVTYEKFPVFIGCTDTPRAKDLLADMSFSICPDSGSIQLDRLIPLDVLYSEYHSEAIGGLWREHHEAFIAFFSKFAPKNVLEIGGSNCFMAERYLETAKDAVWTNVEPNPVASNNPRITVIPKLFDADFSMKGPIDAIIHSHVIEHMYDPDAFLRTVSGFLREGSLHVFSLPDLDTYLEKGYSNCVNFEHSIFLTEYFVDYFLTKNGFKIIKKKKFKGHSIFYATRKTTRQKPLPLVSKYKEYKRRFLTYVKNNRKIVVNINKKIKNKKGGVYLFGAHIFSQALLNSGLDAKRIRFVLDNSKIKQGKRLYGTGLLVQSPEILASEKSPIIILRVGAYKKEISDQIKKINLTAVFIE